MSTTFVKYFVYIVFRQLFACSLHTQKKFHASRKERALILPIYLFLKKIDNLIK